MSTQQLPITQRVKDFNDICTIAGKDPASYAITDGMDAEEQYATHCKKIRLIAQVLNEGKELNWQDTNQRKWIPWFYWNGSAFVFSLSAYNFGGADTALGSRFATEELADFAGRTFLAEYIAYINAR